MHYHALLLFVFLIGLGRAERISVIDQLDVSMDTMTSKLPSQKFTDILPELPRLFAMDDFVLPLNISENITVMQFSFAIVRHRIDADPDSITLVLMYNNASIEGPGEVFFSRSVRAPNNPPRWHNDSLGGHEIITLNLTQYEECSEHANHLFDLHNTTFLPRQTRLWVGFYVTGTHSINMSRAAQPATMENTVYWCMTNQSDPSPRNAPYFFIDEANILRKGLSVWSNASTVEKALPMFRSASHNMAWSLTLLSGSPPTFLEQLVRFSAKNTVLIIICSILVLVILSCCCYCVCAKCRRCRIRIPWPFGKSKNKETAYSKVDSHAVPTYNMNNTKESDTSISLESQSSSVDLYSSKQASRHNPSLKSTPSGRFIQENVANASFRSGGGDNSKQD